MLLMLPSLRRVWEESEAVADSMPVPSQKGVGKLWDHLWNGAFRTWYLEASNMEPARTCLSMNTVNCPMQPCSSAPMLVSKPHHPFAPTVTMDSYLSLQTLTIVNMGSYHSRHRLLSTCRYYYSLYLLYHNTSVIESHSLSPKSQEALCFTP